MDDATPSPGGDSPQPGWFARLFAWGNPIYLMSAASMLLGFLLLTNDLSYKRVSVAQGTTLLATLAIYQGALFLAGVFLAKRRGVIRDGAILLVLDAIFLADVTFVQSNLITAIPGIGLAIGLVLSGLGLIRVQWVCAQVGAPLSWHRAVSLAGMLFLLPSAPAILKSLDLTGQVGPIAFYGLWWLVALFAAMALGADSVIPNGPSLGTHVARMVRAMQPTYLALTWVSLAAHLGMLHWVYNVPFQAPMATPVMLVFVVLIKRCELLRWVHRPESTMIQCLFVVAAVLTSVRDPHGLAIQIFVGKHLVVSSWIFALAAGYVVTTLFIFTRYIRQLSIVGFIIALWWMYGPTAEQTVNGILAWANWVITTAYDATPKTNFAWGIIAIAIAFGLLAAGVAISLRKPADVELIEE